MKISVIIPTLNEAEYLPATLAALQQRSAAGGPAEVIVADCGSADGTPRLAVAHGATLVEGKDAPLTSRAQALNAGAARASGDVLLFLDADSLPPLGFDRLVLETLQDPGVVGGAFEFAFEGKGFGLRLVEVLNRVRYRVRPWYYGDQGIFARTEVFRAVGGYPPRRVLESSDLCKALHRRGRLVLLPQPVLTSPRRFLEDGVYRVLANDIRLWWLDMFERSTKPYEAAYQANNIRRGKTASTH